MPILKDIAQVLRVHEQGNTSIVAVMLGRRLGQFRVHIKGGRRWPKKGFEHGFDLLTRGEILVYPRPDDALWVFREWDERGRPHFGLSLGALRIGSFLCELSEALTRATSGSHREVTHASDEDEPAPLFDALSVAGEALASRTHPGQVALRFALRALDAEGLLPDLEHCAECEMNLARTPRPAWLSADGLICAECHRKAVASKMQVPLRRAALSAQALRVLQIYASDKPLKPVVFNRAAARQLAAAVIVLVHTALEHDLRTLAFAARAIAAAGK